MITAGTYPPIYIDFGSNEPGMTLQREYNEDGYRVWRDYLVDGKVVSYSHLLILKACLGVSISWWGNLHPDTSLPPPVNPPPVRVFLLKEPPVIDGSIMQKREYLFSVLPHLDLPMG